MSTIPVNLSNTQMMLQNDCQELRTFQAWIAQRYTSYSQNLTTTAMTAMGITGSDQTAVLALIADFARINAFLTGTPQAVAADVRIDIVNVLGVL